MARALFLALVLVFSGALAPAFAQGLSEKEAKAFQERALALHNKGRHREALAAAEEWAKAAEKSEGQKPGATTATALGNVAWHALFAKRPNRTLAASERAMALNPDTLWIETNRAHALLFLGRTKMAIAAYIAHKGETLPDNSKWDDAILKDFAEFRKRGLDHTHFRRVEEALAAAPDSPEVLNQTALKLANAGKYAEATALAERYLAAMKSRYGEEHPKYATALVSLASRFKAQGRNADAEPLYSRALAIRERVLGPGNMFTLVSVNNLAHCYQNLGRYGEAEPLLKRALEGFEREFGPDDALTLAIVNNLGSLYRDRGRYAEAEPLYRRALESRERVLGKEDPDTLESVSILAHLYEAQGRYAEAETLDKRALEARERILGKEHPHTLISVNNLSAVYYSQGRYAEAEPLLRRALVARERLLGKDHPDTLTGVSNLASLYSAQGRYAEAKPLYRRALEARERLLGKEHPDTLRNLNNLAALYEHEGRYAEGEALARRALEAQERVLGPNHPETLDSLITLAVLYDDQQRYKEAEALYRRVLEALERVSGKEHPDTLTAVSNLGSLFYNQDMYAEAEPLILRALEARERVLGKEHPVTLISVNNLAELRRDQGRYAEAEALYKRFLEAADRVFGPEHPLTFTVLQNVGHLYHDWGRYAEAEPLYRRAIEGRERTLGAGHPDTLLTVNGLAALYFEQGDFARAVELWRRSTAGLASRTLRGTQQGGVAGKKKTEAERRSKEFWKLVKSGFRLAPEGTAPEAGLTAEMFEAAQWAQSSDAAQSLSQMAARGAAANPGLAALARERQDLVLEWQKRDALHNAALAKPAAKRDAIAEAENTARLAAIDARLSEIDAKLKAEFPDFAALASPAPLPLSEAQALLGDSEALVLFLDTPDKKPTPEETFIWVVTKTQARWVRSELGKAALAREVEALRCGLDAAAWNGPACAGLTGQQYSDADAAAGKPLPFDPARAHKLYKALFGQAEDLIQGKQLLLVPSGALTPAAVPGAGDGRAQGWHAAGLAHPRSRADRAARGVLAQGAAPADAGRQGGEAHDRVR